ncbi:UDP-N-acetylmuramoyl-L-alanine--D-glutamate ligase [Nocardioides lianchengensis]|uniref:UDP-N-acetylmuramoylalanine--D-glutamate ligase n=1 Tax=Nocardioides lianchengensis TaxID=1045774 RepID=A0A1G6XUA4_9ACTN|nr:UDP-N-acetylmuramoyl-L-alanine--D-glutamate ligase [Nocardioides lianchengensis]NYG13443.1 UDP-N-acetylmuramoylalanine--D-glutamate ligase [Nocardioides lianchengensis]SDD81758.1 UDP-N-acetylmuramoylalanine--D-glutamate ligase [Nocardioides lianchengensis]
MIGAGTGWRGLAGLRVGVWGVGVEGSASLRRLAADGVTPYAVVDRVAGDGVLALDAGGLDRLLECDVVVKSPGISPYDEPARTLTAAGVRLAGGLGLWLEDAPRDRVACLTGTKGKSTATAIAGALATGLGSRAFVGGNIGRAPWEPGVEEADVYLVETSSYQAHDVTTGPRVVAVTSLSQDHLVWHHGYDGYVRDKLSLCTRPGVETVVAPAADAELERYADLLGPHVLRVAEAPAPWADGLGLIGRHNLRNALLAQAVLAALGVPGAEDEGALAAAAASYTPLPSRLTRVGAVGDVEFVDDSLSTNTLPTLAAVASFPGRRVALLVGGQDRGIDYAPLAAGLADVPDLLVLTLPDNGPRIASTIRAVAPGVPVEECPDLASAVRRGHAFAAPDGVVLLSPAAPSFGVFRDYAERAEVFTAAMRALPHG